MRKLNLKARGYSKPRVSIQIVTWNSRKFLKDCLDSVFAQTYPNFSVLVVDNASDDGSAEFVKENYPPRVGLIGKIGNLIRGNPDIYVMQNVKNLGFARAHNQGFAISQADFILVLNPDVILEPDFLEKLVKSTEKQAQNGKESKRLGSLGGKMLKVRLGDVELDEKITTKIIDSTGLKIFRNRRVIDRGEGEKDKGQYDKKNKVFGISGACVLYNRAMLEDLKLPLPDGRFEYFDEDFFAYKEDVDLAWRANLFGWLAVYVPEAGAYHFRGGAPVNQRFSQSHWVNFFSYRNHLWMLAKNSFCSNSFRHLWLIFWYQLSKEFYLLITQPGILFGGGFSFWGRYYKMTRKRKYIFKKTKVRAKEMRKWFQ